MASTERARIWSFVGYPNDSLPDNYSEILSDELHLCWAESPIHNADLNGDGSQKKAHIHFILSFEGMKSFDQVLEITNLLHCPIPQKCRNARSLVRYFIHLDNPEKHQYKMEDIKTHGGFEIEEYFRKSEAETRTITKEILQFCYDNNINEFCELAEIVLQMNNDDWFDAVIRKQSVFFSLYLKSRHFREEKLKADMERRKS